MVTYRREGVERVDARGKVGERGGGAVVLSPLRLRSTTERVEARGKGEGGDCISTSRVEVHH